ncbi:MAG: hypothetical protein KME18_18245 [Phormidium tanganyikae FI6-MK23]|nr:hypothetical protein [Phormidium tanganyikae FI6-MK23]
MTTKKAINPKKFPMPYGFETDLSKHDVFIQYHGQLVKIPGGRITFTEPEQSTAPKPTPESDAEIIQALGGYW